MKSVCSKGLALLLAAVLVLVLALGGCGNGKGYLPSQNATWGELCRHFQSEWFDSLPEEVQAEYDQLLLNEIPPKREDSENPETGREEAAIRSEGAEGYSVYVVDEGAMTLPQSKVPEGIITLMMGLRAEKEAVGYRVSTFCDQEGAQVFLMVALMDAQTGEYLAVQPYSSAIDRMYQTEEAFAKLKSKTDYTVKAIAWVTASGSVNNGALYAESSITTE